MKKHLYILLAAVFAAYLPLSAEPPDQKSSAAPPSSSTASPSGGDKSSSTPPSSSTASPSGGSQSSGGGTGGSSGAAAKPQTLPFTVYIDQGNKGNHYIPSGWMGDFGDLKVNPGCTDSPHGGKTCIKADYSAKMANGAGWAGVFWQHPANNWGDKKGGFNLTGAKKVTFWARGAKGGEKIGEFKVGGITGEFPDTDSASIGPIELTNNWKQYSIDLNGKDLSNIIGGFAWAASKDDNPEGFTIYIDDIAYE